MFYSGCRKFCKLLMRPFQSRRRLILVLAFFAILFASWFTVMGPARAQTEGTPQVAYPITTESKQAAAPAEKAESTSVAEGIGNALSKIPLLLATFCIQLTIFILQFVIEVASYNKYLDSPAVQVGWTMVRDIANMFFVFILLIIAFGTILGSEQYEYKKLLFKFILAAVLVNFSALICAVIIDVGQVIMITFINGVAATAGGNLINAFNINDIVSMSGQKLDPGFWGVITASIAALFFASIMMCVMGAYLIILLARMIVLWILIVLSPLAFIFSVLPQSKTYADQWLKEFGNHVIVGPALVFFLWLSFVTVGAGNIHQTIADGSSFAMNTQVPDATAVGGPDSTSSAGPLSIMSWAKMANFFIAVGMLLVGARVTQQLGVVGGSMAGKAISAGTKLGMALSGATMARSYAEKKGELYKLKAQNLGYNLGSRWNLAMEGVGKKAGGLVGKGAGKLLGKEAGEGVGKFIGERMTGLTQFGTTQNRIDEAKKQLEMRQKLFGSSVTGYKSEKETTAYLEQNTKKVGYFKDAAKAKLEEGAIKELKDENPKDWDRAQRARIVAEEVKRRTAEEDREEKAKTKEEMGKAIPAGISDEERKDREKFKQAETAVLESKAVADQIAAKLSTQEQIKELEKIEELLKDSGSGYGARRADLYEAKAKLGYAQTENTRSERGNIAEAQAKNLENQGRFNKATQVRMREASLQSKENIDEFAGSSQAHFKAYGIKMVKDLQDLQAKYTAAKATGDVDTISTTRRNLSKGMAESAALQAAAAQSAPDTAQALQDVMLAELGYKGDTSMKNQPDIDRMMVSGLTSINPTNAAEIETLLGEGDMHKKNAILKAVNDARISVATKSGNIRGAAGISSGLAADRATVVYGFGGRAGNFDTSGVAHAGPAPDFNTKITGWLQDHISVKDAPDATAIFAKIGGKDDEIDTHALTAVAKYAKKAAPDRIGEYLSQGFVGDLNRRAATGTMSKVQAKKIMSEFRDKIKNDETYDQVEKMLSDVVVRAT